MTMTVIMTVIVDFVTLEVPVWQDDTPVDLIFEAQQLHRCAELCQHAIDDSLLLETLQNVRI